MGRQRRARPPYLRTYDIDDTATRMHMGVVRVERTRATLAASAVTHLTPPPLRAPCASRAYIFGGRAARSSRMFILIPLRFGSETIGVLPSPMTKTLPSRVA